MVRCQLSVCRLILHVPLLITIAKGAGGAMTVSTGPCSKRLSSTFVVIFLTPKPPPLALGLTLSGPLLGGRLTADIASFQEYRVLKDSCANSQSKVGKAINIRTKLSQECKKSRNRFWPQSCIKPWEMEEWISRGKLSVAGGRVTALLV